jgi:hypothetical protein
MKGLLLPPALSLLLAANASAQLSTAADSSSRTARQTAAGTPDSSERLIARADAGGTFGWMAINKSELDTYNDNDWLGHSYVAGGAFGWYWTNHVKTSVDAGWSNQVSIYTPVEEQNAAGQPVFGARQWGFRRTRVGIMQQYQFRNNEWFHPFAAAGLEFVRERTTRQDEPVYAFDPATRQTIIVRPGRTQSARAEWKTLGAVAGGFKWYFTRRGFFSSEARVTFDRRPDEVILRMGAGVDF